MRTACVLVVVVALAGCGGGAKPAAAPNGKQNLRAREELQAAVIGKKKADVLKLLGKPHRTQESSGLGAIWVYSRVSYDPVTGEVDASAELLFNTAGVVTGVLF